MQEPGVRQVVVIGRDVDRRGDPYDFLSFCDGWRDESGRRVETAE